MLDRTHRPQLGRWYRRRRRIRQLRHAIELVEQSYAQDLQRNDDASEAAYGAIQAETLLESQELDVLETQPLWSAARRLGLDVEKLRLPLDYNERQRLRRRIHEARIAYWRAWAELLVPVLSLLVALAALTLD